MNITKFLRTAFFIQFVLFKPLSYCFEEATGFDVKVSFSSRLKKKGWGEGRGVTLVVSGF